MWRRLKDEIQDVAPALWRMALSLILLTFFILGEWFIIWLIRNTIEAGNPDPFSKSPFNWAKTLSQWAVALIWGIHVLAETVFWILQHLPRDDSRG